MKLKFCQRLFHFSDLMYSLQLRKNLISDPKFDIKGVKYTDENGKMEVSKDGQHLFTTFLKNDIYHLYPNIPIYVPKKVNPFGTMDAYIYLQKVNTATIFGTSNKEK